MVHVPDDILMAYVDGELSAEEVAWLEREFAADPQLRQRLEPFTLTRKALPVVFDPLLKLPLPERLLTTVREPGSSPNAQVGRLAETAASRSSAGSGGGGLRALLDRILPSGGSYQPAWGYVGMLVLGIGTGWAASGLIGSSSEGGSVLRSYGGAIVADGALQEALEHLPAGGIAGRPGSSDTIRPVATFRNESGRICRQYFGGSQQDAEGAFSGLACRDPGGVWRITLHSQLPAEPENAENGFATPVGAGADHGAIGASLEQTLRGLAGGAPMSPTEEDYFIRKGWDASAREPNK